MDPVRFIFCLHNHQPIGNFDRVIASSYERAYLPFLELAAEHPLFRFSLHTSGCLLEWLEVKRPEYFQLLRKLVKREQAELLAGAMYEPILPIWPEAEIVEQIARHRAFLRTHFDVESDGFWLPERVWEPYLAGVLHRSGINFLPLDDHIFSGAGVEASEMFGYYVTEHAGKTVDVFPVPQKLRYTIPFRPPGETVRFLRTQVLPTASRVVTYADDGEKFGSWPGTHTLVYKRRWLQRFVKAALAESEWLQFAHFRAVRAAIAPLGRVHLPAGSYREMSEWAQALRTRSARSARSARNGCSAGATWRNFLVKYPEANRLHKTVVAFTSLAEDGRKSARAAARTHLLRAQCNCPYWHGVFGGLYLPHLRSAPYEELARARALTAPRSTKVHVADHDGDGLEDVHLAHPHFDLHLAPARGGALELILQHSPPFNWACTLTRREEAYHRELKRAARAKPSQGKVESIHAPMASKERRLDRHLWYDRWERASLVDRFLTGTATLEQFQQDSYTERGNFADARYGLDTEHRRGLSMECKGQVKQGRRHLPVTVTKTIRAEDKQARFTVSYQIDSVAELTGRFGVEWNLTALAPAGKDHWIEVNDKRAGEPRGAAKYKSAHSFTLVDRWAGRAIRVAADQPFGLWRCGLYTVSMSESGYERVYQQTAFLPWFDLTQSQNLEFCFTVELLNL